MGIGNDIKPKKGYSSYGQHKNSPIKKAPIKYSLSENEEDNKIGNHKGALKLPDEIPALNLDTEQLDELKDEFFSSKKTSTKKKKTPTLTENAEKTGGFFHSSYKILIWTAVAVILVLVVYQNFDSIKSLIKNDNQASNNSSEQTATPKDDYYTSTNDTNSSSNTSSSTNTTTETPATVPSATTPATTTPATQSKDFTIAVLNGNGISGSAEKISTSLTALGFSITSTGNAKSFKYSSTYIYYKGGQETNADLVKAALSDRTITLQQSDTLTGKNDILIVVGKK